VIDETWLNKIRAGVEAAENGYDHEPEYDQHGIACCPEHVEELMYLSGEVPYPGTFAAAAADLNLQIEAFQKALGESMLASATEATEKLGRLMRAYNQQAPGGQYEQGEARSRRHRRVKNLTHRSQRP
jgi:hypothetical protein